MSRALAAATALAALGAGLAACGGASTSTVTTTATAAAVSATATGTDPSSATTASAASQRAGIASPGSKLTVGQAAKVAYSPAESSGRGKPSTLLVTVQSFQKGSLSDFNGIQLDATQKASIPYYVKVHVRNLGPNSIDVDGTAAAIEGVDSTGNNQSSVTFIGSFPRCPDAASTTPIPAGKGYDDCMTFLVPGGIKKISYNGTTGYINSPVTWAPN